MYLVTFEVILIEPTEVEEETPVKETEDVVEPEPLAITVIEPTCACAYILVGGE